MGLGASALDIGRSALLTYQSALQVTGNNVSNAGNPDYTRQTAALTAVAGPFTAGLNPGAGVAMTAIQRHMDETLENRLRLAIANREKAAKDQELMSSFEALFDDANGSGLSTVTLEFFNTLAEVQNDASDPGLRDLAVSSGASLADAIQTLRSNLLAQVEAQTEQAAAYIEEADRLTQEIADLNGKISASSASANGLSGPLRDQRDAAVRRLSEIIDVQVRVQGDGSAYVYLGSEALVQGGVARGLVAEEILDGDLRTVQLRFADTNSVITPKGGKLGALVSGSGEQVVEWLGRLDQLAGSIIAEFNKVHADGQGLNRFESVTGTFEVQDPTAALSSTDLGMAPTPENGSFYISVYDDATNTGRSYQIEVDLDGIGTDDSLTSLVDKINAEVIGVTAEVTVDNRLSITAASGSSFYFGLEGGTQRQDTSGVLAALGVNTFFSGTTAADIAVNPLLLANSDFLAASQSGLSGDGNNAGQLALVGEAASDLLGGAEPLTYYGAIANEVAITSASARTETQTAETVLGALQAQRESISGVNLDEEAIQLVRFEQAYQGAARYISVVNQTLQELMSIVG